MGVAGAGVIYYTVYYFTYANQNIARKAMPGGRT